MVYNFGGGLCSGYAGNPYFNGYLIRVETHQLPNKTLTSDDSDLYDLKETCEPRF